MAEPEVEESYWYRFRLRCLGGIRKHKYLAAALFLGQLLSLLLCGTGVTSQLLEERHSIAVPTSQAFLNYILLAAVFGTFLATTKDFIKILKHNWWKYAMLGMIDVEANYIIIRAYEYTNLTSIQLLDSFSLASVMLLSYIFLHARYKLVNIMGVLLSLIGIATLVLADSRGSRLRHGSNPLLGDMLCLIGAVLYAISNVAQEFLVKNHSVLEYLGLIGVSGSIVSAVQLIILERHKLAQIDWNADIGLLFGGFGVALFLFYSTMPLVMKFTSAMVVNLSLLTADIYTLLFGLFVFHYKFSLFYLLALILIVAGVFIYNLKQPGPTSRRRNRNDKDRRLHTGGGRVEGFEHGSDTEGLLESQTLELSTGPNAASSYGSNAESENPLRERGAKARSS